MIKKYVLAKASDRELHDMGIPRDVYHAGEIVESDHEGRLYNIVAFSDGEIWAVKNTHLIPIPNCIWEVT